jgi:signal transduction histidine kinase
MLNNLLEAFQTDPWSLAVLSVAVVFALVALWLWVGPKRDSAPARNDDEISLKELYEIRKIIHDFRKTVENLLNRMDELKSISIEQEERWRQLIEKIDGDIEIIHRGTDRISNHLGHGGGQRLDIYTICEEIRDRHNLRARERDIDFALWPPNNPHLPTIIGDREGISSLVENIILNAIRNAGKKDPTVSLKIINGQQKIIIQVTNTGPGFQKSQLTKVKRFFAGQANEPGTGGLGLKIIRDKVYENDGEVQVESQPGKTQFTVEFPVKTSAIRRRP